MIKTIRLQNFRSYENAAFDFAASVNVIAGPNASGKTNLLEAVMVAALGASYRVRDADLVRFEQDWARLDARTADNDVRVVKLRLERSGMQVRKAFEIDERPYQKLSSQKTLPTVLFEPDHLLMLTGPPDMRRTFLDSLIEQTVPGFATVRRNYRRALAQRNALLKQGELIARPQIFAWNLRLSELGGLIARERLQLIERMNNHADDIYEYIAGRHSNVAVAYKTSCPLDQYESALLHKLEANVSRDCMIGFTTAGPHRDDLRLTLAGREIAESASRGETRTLVLALKVIELRLLHEIRGIAPILLLDDVFSELDAHRRAALTSFLPEYQVFITTTDADVAQSSFAQESRIIRMGEPAAG